MEKKDSNPPPPQSINVLHYSGASPNYDIELIPSIGPPHLQFNSVSDILLYPIISYLKSIGYDLQHSRIWYNSLSSSSKIYCGNDPLPLFTSIPLFELKDNNTITIISQEPVRNIFGTISTVGNHCPELKPQEEAITKDNAARRTKERKIGFIVEKVSKWRKLYKGNLKSEVTEKMDLDVAGDQVGIPKKSLDDYYLQIKAGKKFGFNFQEHRDDKVGVLRAFVKKFKGLKQYESQIEAGEEIPNDIVMKLQEPGTPACKHNRCCAPEFAMKFKCRQGQY